jgi:hypothetical protein
LLPPESFGDDGVGWRARWRKSRFYWIGVAFGVVAAFVCYEARNYLTATEMFDEVGNAFVLFGAVLTALGVALAPGKRERFQRQAYMAHEEALRLTRSGRLKESVLRNNLVAMNTGLYAVEKAMVEASDYARAGATFVVVGGVLLLVNPLRPALIYIWSKC